MTGPRVAVTRPRTNGRGESTPLRSLRFYEDRWDYWYTSTSVVADPDGREFWFTFDTPWGAATVYRPAT